jgi:uncharacterized Zn finger protein (UPF0148 family)
MDDQEGALMSDSDPQLVCPFCGGDLVKKDGFFVCVKGDYQREIDKSDE